MVKLSRDPKDSDEYMNMNKSTLAKELKEFVNIVVKSTDQTVVWRNMKDVIWEQNHISVNFVDLVFSVDIITNVIWIHTRELKTLNAADVVKSF